MSVRLYDPESPDLEAAGLKRLLRAHGFTPSTSRPGWWVSELDPGTAIPLAHALHLAAHDLEQRDAIHREAVADAAALGPVGELVHLEALNLQLGVRRVRASGRDATVCAPAVLRATRAIGEARAEIARACREVAALETVAPLTGGRA